ncbi:interferon-induced transmembrane protein 2-like isoform X2 [Anolis sagrei]|uniref:interferon-induced transmembrane protein 2-like isoform X2 n=1 Tax=Anolis sagrei TaxID=38937 RepID=UPI0035214DCB
MQHPSDPAVCLNMQPYSSGYEKDPNRPFLTQARGSAAAQPNDYFLWSIFNFGFFNTCCLGFIALVFSVKKQLENILQVTSGVRELTVCKDASQRMPGCVTNPVGGLSHVPALEAGADRWKLTPLPKF